MLALSTVSSAIGRIGARKSSDDENAADGRQATGGA